MFNIRTFTKGVDMHSGRKLSSEEHARCALHLLQTLPAARLAVLEYLCHIFDERVNLYMYELEGESTCESVNNKCILNEIWNPIMRKILVFFFSCMVTGFNVFVIVPNSNTFLKKKIKDENNIIISLTFLSKEYS